MNSLTISNETDDFLLLFRAWRRTVIESTLALARKYVALLDANPQFRDDLLDQAPDISARDLVNLERIGRTQLHPQLAFPSPDKPGRTFLARCSYSEQLKHLESPVPVVLQNQPSEHLLVAVDSLNYEQCRQVFAKDHVRSLAEQRAWLDAEQRRIAKGSSARWRVRGGRVRILETGWLTRAEIEQIWGELKK
jgi:hypothetical protein